MAYKITGCKELSKDLVQDMYLRIGTAKPQPTKLTEGYIYATMVNLHKNNVKKDTTFIDKGITNKVFIISLDNEDNKYILNER
jgi:DNA-directed RNA polymerase specialized sigma24 family protein